MPKPPTRPTSLATWTAAADQAESAPHDHLPCPGCGASVRGVNLAEHVRRVHMADDRARPEPARRGLIGLDRRIRQTGRAVKLLWVAGMFVLVQRSNGVFIDAVAAFDDAAGEPTFALARPHLEAVVRTPFGTVFLGGLVAIVVASILGRAGRFRARVAVVDGHLVLRHRLGTGTRRVRLPAPVESGTLIRRVGGADGDESGSGGEGYDEHVGTYLRVGSGRRAITVGCASTTELRSHWEGWASGRPRTRWDITLAPAEFVAVQYALAHGGSLIPRRSPVAA